MTTECWKLEKDLCRCCHSEGYFQNLSENTDSNVIYSKMLKDAFNIDMEPLLGELSNVTYTICKTCILRLNEATIFKNQVVACEERLKEIYCKNLIEVYNPNLQNDVAVKLEKSDDDLLRPYSPIRDDDDYAYEDDYVPDDDKKEDMYLEEVKTKKTASKKRTIKSKKKRKAGRPKKYSDDGTINNGNEDSRGEPDVESYITENDTVKRYTCRACEISYKRISDLRNHITRTHLKKKLIKCDICPETFTYHVQRKQHMLIHTNQKPDIYKCDHCNRNFKRKNTLAEHMSDEHILKKCEHCTLKFARKKFMFHANEMHGVLIPTCGICGLKTLRQSALIRHQRNVHLNEKNIKCYICLKKFFTKSNLSDHLITHTQDKIYKCDVCEKSFSRKECLKTHQRIHTGERPFACGVCSAAFIQRASLRFHVRSHHPSVV